MPGHRHDLATGRAGHILRELDKLGNTTSADKCRGRRWASVVITTYLVHGPQDIACGMPPPDHSADVT